LTGGAGTPTWAEKVFNGGVGQGAAGMSNTRLLPWPGMVAPAMALPTVSALMATGSGPAEGTILAANSRCAYLDVLQAHPARRLPDSAGDLRTGVLEIR
jgi:hypothetical protein